MVLIPLELSVKFSDLSKRVFEENRGSIKIGGELIKPELLDLLREQAIYLSTSQLYEILLCTLKDEAANLALIQSKDWDSVQFAKALHHTAFVLENMILKLKNK